MRLKSFPRRRFISTATRSFSSASRWMAAPSGRVPRHCSANGQYAAQPKSICGLTKRWPQPGQVRAVSSLKNSTARPQRGQPAS